jgi:hypothetical protein
VKHRLTILNLVLLALVLLAGHLLKERWTTARAREEALLKRMIPSAPAPALSPVPPVAPATASSYLDVAQHMLFARDRNPNVILDPPAPPPPPKPMPGLPVAYGVMNLGDGPTAILSVKPGAEHKAYRAGERVGEFKVVAMNNQEILFEWEGKHVKKRLEELMDKRSPAPAPAQEAPQQAPPAAAGSTSLGSGGTKAGPGADMGNQTRACVPGDETPAGTVQDGMRKVVTKTPFGEQCRWEPVK